MPLMFDAMQPFNGEARIVVAACDNLVTTAAEVAELPWSKFVTLMKVRAPAAPCTSAPHAQSGHTRGAVVAPAACFHLSPALAACGGVVAHAQLAHVELWSIFDVLGLGFRIPYHQATLPCGLQLCEILCIPRVRQHVAQELGLS